MRSVSAIVLCMVLNVAAGQRLENLTELETQRVFSRLGPAVQILGKPYVQDTIYNRMRYYDVPGIGIALIENNEVRWTKYFGVLDRTYVSSARIDVTTRFMVKSLSKPVTAYATLRLVGQGVLSLDKPLSTYLKRWTIPSNEFTDQNAPTLRLLLSHSAGFTLHGVPSYTEGEPLPTLVQALNGEPPAKPDRVEIDYVPGSATRYSGGGYSVLQLLLEDVTGTPFPQLMQELVLDSLGMKRSLFSIGMPNDIEGFAAVGHGNDGEPIEGKWERLVQMAAGGLISTPEDMALFVIELNRAWSGESEMLSDTLARLMMTPNESGWGLGLEVSGEGARLRYDHTGSGDGFRAVMVGFPALRKGAIILMNGMTGSELRYEILRSLANEYAWPSYRVIHRPAITLSRDRLERYTGTYTYSDGSTTTISLDGDQLSAQWRNMPAVDIYPQTPSLFFTLSNEEFEFTLDNNMEPTDLTWKGSFGAFTAGRVE